MNNHQLKILAAIFAEPVRANILWDDIEALFIAQAHPQKEANKGAMKSVHKFLIDAGIRP